MEKTIKLFAGEITLHVTGVDLDDDSIIEGFAKENPTIYWSDARCKHWIFDFVIYEDEERKVWCEAVKINNKLDEFWLNLFE